jgi:flagellar assembly factor FliW
LALVLVNPVYILDNYSPCLTPEDYSALGAKEDTPLAYYAIAVVHDNWKDSTANLKCPIVINAEKMLGKQIIMEDSSHSMRHPVGPGPSKEG